MLFKKDTLEFVKAQKDNTYQFIILDPPFGKVVKEDWDISTFDFTVEYIYNLYRILKSSGSIYIHCGIGERSQSMIEWFNKFKSSNFIFKDLITWKKNRGIGMRKGYLYTREEILWYVKDNSAFTWNKDFQYTEEKRAFDIHKAGGERVNKSDFKRITNVWQDNEFGEIWEINEVGYGKSPKLFKEIRDILPGLTPKSPLLSDRIIKCHCDRTDKVYIPFAGSGMEIVSCMENQLEWDATEIGDKCIDFISNYILTKKVKLEDFK